MCERYIIKDRWIVDTKLNKKIHSIDCYEEKSILDIMNGQDQRIAELEEQLKNLQEKEKVFSREFAIEQLDKVKDFCDGMKWAMVHLTKENTQTIQTVLDEIDDQIKQLKEGK